MTDYSKITALYSRLSVGDEDRDGGESNSIQNQKIFLENYARGQHLTNIRHYIDDDESGRFFDRSAYSRMMDDVENGKIGVCIMKDLTRWGRDYLQVGNAMEIFRRNNVRFIAVNNGIDSEKPDTLEFAPFINIMSEWYAKDISKKVKTGIKTKGMSGKPIVTEAPYGYVKDPDNKDFWIIDEEAAEVVRLIFRLFIGGKNRNQIAVHLTQEQIPTPTFYMKDRGRGTCKNKTLNEDNRCKWNKATLTNRRKADSPASLILGEGQTAPQMLRSARPHIHHTERSRGIQFHRCRFPMCYEGYRRGCCHRNISVSWMRESLGNCCRKKSSHSLGTLCIYISPILIPISG